MNERSTTWLFAKKDLTHTFMRAPGPGGQNVNKVATAVLLRFNVAQATTLTPAVRTRVYTLYANKINAQGELLVRANRYRTQLRNQQDALTRLNHLLLRAAVMPKKRQPTKPSQGSVQRRLTSKKLHGKTKALRSQRAQLTE